MVDRDEKGRFVKQGFKHSEEWYKKHGEKIKGDNNPAQRLEVREKNRIWHAGRKLSEETKIKMSKNRKGRISPNKGKKLSLEWKKKISDSLKGRVFGYKFKKGDVAPNKGKKLNLTEEQRKQKSLPGEKNGMYGVHRFGDKAPRWIGGKSFEPYGTDWTLTLKKAIRQRDKYICQLCRKGYRGSSLNVHHIDYDKRHNDPENLVSLCRPCHTKTNSKRAYWENFFKVNKTDALLASNQ